MAETDRELLELAAKAAGMDMASAIWHEEMGVFIFTTPRTPNWSPLKNDGDALRLAVKLGLWAAVRDGYQHLASDGDFYAATRLAITRAAAELARAADAGGKEGKS